MSCSARSTRRSAPAPRDAAAVASILRPVDALLRGVPGVLALVDRHELIAGITARLDQLDAYAGEVDAELASIAEQADVDDVDGLEEANRAAIQLRDVLWALRRDRLRTVTGGRRARRSRRRRRRARPDTSSIQQALSAIDRMEVRGRDSAGLHVFVWDHDLTPTDPAVAAALAERSRDPLFQSGAARMVGPSLSIVYKAAAEIGELGDNTASLRAAVQADSLLRMALRGERAQLAVLGHTRWASVGIISEPNAHPVDSFELEQPGGATPPYVVAVLNGDVDNHADLRVDPRAARSPARSRPTPRSSRRSSPHGQASPTGTGPDLFEAFRRTVSSFEGSVAIGAAGADEPWRLLFALHGSGQGVYVGLAEDRYIVASEPYGVVEETDRYVRLDGEHGWAARSRSTAGWRARWRASSVRATTGRRSPSAPRTLRSPR